MDLMGQKVSKGRVDHLDPRVPEVLLVRWVHRDPSDQQECLVRLDQWVHRVNLGHRVQVGLQVPGASKGLKETSLGGL